MSKNTFYCHIDNAEYTLPKYLYPHAKYKKNPEQYAGKWRFRSEAGGTALDIRNYIQDAPELIGCSEAIAMVQQLYIKYWPALAGVKPTVIPADSLLAEFNKYQKRYAGRTLANWSDIKSGCERLCEAVGATPINQITKAQLQDANHTLKPNTQKKIVRCMRAFFVDHLFDRDLVPQVSDNPFNEGGRWSIKRTPIEEAKTDRIRIHKADLRAMINAAHKDQEEWLVDALKISFLLGIRCADVVGLRWDNYRAKEEVLAIFVGKSINKKGAAAGFRLIISKQSHPEVMKIIKRRYKNRTVMIKEPRTRYGKVIEAARYEISQFVIYRKPERLQAKVADGKEQHVQISRHYYSKQFKHYRDTCPVVVQRMEQEGGYICLHEVRSLFARIARAKKYPLDTVREALAHTSKDKGALEDHYMDGVNIEPECMVQLADLQGNEIDETFHDFGELDEAIGQE